MYNSLKASDKRIMTINKDSGLIIFINMGRDTKKIPFDSIIQIQLSPRNIKHDIIIETQDDYVYLDILKQTDT